MFIKKTTAIIIITFILSCCVYASEEPCKQEYIFSPSDQDLLEVVNIPELDILNIDSTARLYNNSRSKFFIIKTGISNEILILTGNEAGIKLQLKEEKHRPLSANWINEKLIYLEVWFNPHFGAYWIYDIENKKIVMHELQNDG